MLRFFYLVFFYQIYHGGSINFESLVFRGGKLPHGGISTKTCGYPSRLLKQVRGHGYLYTHAHMHT